MTVKEFKKALDDIAYLNIPDDFIVRLSSGEIVDGVNCDNDTGVLIIFSEGDD